MEMAGYIVFPYKSYMIETSLRFELHEVHVTNFNTLVSMDLDG